MALPRDQAMVYLREALDDVEALKKALDYGPYVESFLPAYEKAMKRAVELAKEYAERP